MPRPRLPSRRSVLSHPPAAWLLLAAVILLAVTGCSTAASNTQAPAAGADASQEVRRVSVQDAKEALDAGEAVFVDVRSIEAFTASHVAGALSIPLAEIPARLDELDRDRWIITYCT